MTTKTLSVFIFCVFATNCVLAQNFQIISANSGKVLDVTGGSTSDGALIQQWDWLGGSNQQWQIGPLGNGYSLIQNVNSGKVLDVYGGYTTGGTPIQQWDWWGGANQQWQIVPQDSSYNAIFNLNSGMVLDVTNTSLSNGAPIQQWTWLNGLNQQWEIVPVQETYQTIGYTDLYYDSGTNALWVTGSWDVDYSTLYYYGGRIVTTITDNGSWIMSGEVNDPGQIAAWDRLELYVPSVNPGDYYEANSTFYGVAQYTWGQAVLNCGALCGYWYDPFNYDFVESNPQGTRIPSAYGMTYWGAIIVSQIARLGQSIILGKNGGGLTVPGNRGVFDLKVRAFIPAAWVKGAGYPADYCTDAGGGNHGVYYIGDHRDFSPFSRSFRAHSEVIVSAASGSAITSPVFLAGTTTRYSDDALAPDGYTLVGDANYNDCHLTDKVVPGIIAANVLVQSGGFGVVSAELYGDATNMATTYPQLTPSITWDFNYTINAASNPTFPAWTLQYTHDCYPAHEVYIGAQLIYGFKPTSNSPANVGLCLAGVNPVSGSSIGTVN